VRILAKDSPTSNAPGSVGSSIVAAEGIDGRGGHGDRSPRPPLPYYLTAAAASTMPAP
jgi:hypothetical protein